jgi:hypothetical protein
MRFLIVLLICTITSACSIEQPKGLQAVVFEKSDHYSFSLKNTNNQQTIKTISNTLLQNINNNLFAEIYINYGNQRAKSIAQNVKTKLATRGIAPSHIHVISSKNLTHDIEITNVHSGIKSKLCAAEMIGRKTQQSGCYVDSLRLKQMNHPEHLYQQSK